jgi:cyclic 2,3-diphosphoglycerate synthetase
VGKTAVSGYIARVLREVVTGREGGPAVVVVAMGRGGPAKPEVIEGESGRLTVAELVARSRQGVHAASDYFEDALLSRVTTVGCRRCGAGMAGEPFYSNVREGVELANSLRPGLIVLEGSGAAVPPVAADARLLVAGAHQPIEHIAGYLGTYRLLASDAVVLAMAEEPLATEQKVRCIIASIAAVKPGMAVVPVVFRPHPAGEVAGKKVAFFSTAPAAQEAILRRFLEERWGCRVELYSAHLADRAALRADLDGSAMAEVEMVLTEIKAAAIDMVASEAEARGLPVVPVDNVPTEVGPAEPGDLGRLALELGELATRRFAGRPFAERSRRT